MNLIMRILSTVILAALLVFAVVGCGTPFGIRIANALESPATAKVLAAASAAGAVAITNATGDKLTPEQQDLLRSAAVPALNAGGTGIVWAIGEALRTKQGTAQAASAPALASVVATNSGASSAIARPVALAVRDLTHTGVTADVANEAVALVVQSVAQQKDGMP